MPEQAVTRAPWQARVSRDGRRLATGVALGTTLLRCGGSTDTGLFTDQTGSGSTASAAGGAAAGSGSAAGAGAIGASGTTGGGAGSAGGGAAGPGGAATGGVPQGAGGFGGGGGTAGTGASPVCGAGGAVQDAQAPSGSGGVGGGMAVADARPPKSTVITLPPNPSYCPKSAADATGKCDAQAVLLGGPCRYPGLSCGCVGSWACNPEEQCNTASDCVVHRLCDTNVKVCVDCFSSTDCQNPALPQCDPIGRHCAECLSDTDCHNPSSPGCIWNRSCAQCSKDAQCPTNQTCHQFLGQCN